MKKRILSILLAICMLMSVIPVGTMTLTAAETTSDVTVTVLDENGNKVTNSNLSVTVTRTYVLWRTNTQNISVTNYGTVNGDYGVFGYNFKNSPGTTQYYTINATLTDDGKNYTASSQVSKDATSVVLTLEDYTQGDKWVTFDVYYIADGHFPETFYGFGDEKDYGPAGNDTPLLQINVNVTQLQDPEYSEYVLYQQNVNNAYHFIPAKQSESKDKEEAYEQNLKYAEEFWAKVIECMDKPSIDAFKATGLFDTYVVYCLKNQGTAANPDNHADGILKADPPVYVVEMYDYNNEIFGGHTNDKNNIDTDPFMLSDVRAAYTTHFNQVNDWKEIDGVWTGSYITEENGRKYKYTLKIVQTNIDNATVTVSKKSDIKYQQRTNMYYVATFKSERTDRELVDCILTYTDGIDDIDNNVFVDQVIPIEKGKRAEPFTGSTYRENYIFLGWTLLGGDGTILSQDDIINIAVNEDLTFVAQYAVAPTKYTGTVEVILNGSYDSTDATATGERIDITEIVNYSLYVSADGVNYIPLERTSEGVYSARLENGDYKIYYYNGSEYLESSSQHLSINNDNRTRYLFFNKVTYNLNGGVGGPQSLLQYKYIGTSVNVESVAPTKEGYIFRGWKDENGNIYNSGELLTASIGKGYTLTAQWADASDIYINVTINHTTADGIFDDATGNDDVTLNLVYAPDKNTPFLETGDSIKLCKLDHKKHDYTYKPEDVTVYTANGPTFTNVLKDNIYTVFTDKHDYNVTSITTDRTADGDIIIDVVLDYAPENADLEFEVKVADDVPTQLVPQAAIVKVLYWSTTTNKWEVIAEHADSVDGKALKPGVRVDINSDTRKGTGIYSVFTKEVQEGNMPIPYGYRIVVTSLVYPDGNIVSVNNSAFENLTVNNTDLYTIEFGDVVEGNLYDNVNNLNGAYFNEKVQHGLLDATITATGYNVTFDAQGGTVNGYDKQPVPNQYKVPSFGGYVPTRSVGYVFDGWYKDTNFTIPAVEGEYLNSDITLYAKWKEPLKVEGMITVGATFEQINEDLSKTIQKIPESERVKTLIVMLQRVEPNGYTDTINQIFISLDYGKSEYYYNDGINGDRIVGHANYLFENIPDDGSKYRVQVLIPNYHSTFQNENESLRKPKDYPSYNHEDYIAKFGETDKTTATVNVHSHFSPEEFELKYSVNAEQIGIKLRPTKTEILVTADGLESGLAPDKWDVISQMVFGDKFIGDKVEIKKGKGEGSDNVWVNRADGYTLYQYGIRVQDVVLGNGKTVKYDENQPFTVEYMAPAHYHDYGQHGELIATLIPKTYNVKFITNGGTLNGDYPTNHTWSYDTSIAGIVPTFDNFKFDGWYLDKDLTIPASDVIDAEVASDVTLYAKWIQVMDVVDLIVTVKHNVPNGGLASNYNKTLYTQLTYAERGIPFDEQVYIDMPGYAKNYPNGQWHTHGDKVREDIFEVPSYYTYLSAEYDYGVNVMLEGYYVAEKKVKKVKQPDGSTLHIVNVTLQYDPELFDMTFYVSMAKGIDKEVYPESAEVKVTCWYDDPAANTDWDWTRITQRVNTTITVNIDSEKGYGEATYPVWLWYDKEQGIPYHYRIEIIQLNMKDGTAVHMNETVADVSYSGGGYNAEIVVDEYGEVPTIENKDKSATTLSGVYGKAENGVHYQQGTVGAIIDVNKVIFHANNQDAKGGDDFRTYYPAGSVPAESELNSLNADNTVSMFYDIPEFDYNTHNKYIFKGWYLDEKSTDNPIDWNATYSGTTHVYAHWINVGTVQKTDTKDTVESTYLGFDLIGVQIRDKEVDKTNHYGEAGSGLRFITVLSEEVYEQINAIAGNGEGAEYGFVLARSSTAERNAVNNNDFTLQLKGENINGINTSTTHSFVQNLKCSGVEDHYKGEDYRLYTAVITYKNHTGDRLEQEYNEKFAARSYIKYYDANGVERVHYNNYKGESFYGGCSTSFAAVRDIVTN